MCLKALILALVLTLPALAFADSEFSAGAVRGITQPFPIGIAPVTSCAGGLDQSILFLTGNMITCNDPNLQWDYTNNIFKINESGGDPGLIIQGGGTIAELTSNPPVDGTQAYCNDCNVATDPCTGGGSGSEAWRLNGRWMCTGAGAGGSITGSGTNNVLTKWTGASTIGDFTVTDDTVPVGNGTAHEAKAVPNCTDTGTNHLNYTAATNSFSCGTASGTGTVTSVGLSVPSSIFGTTGSPVTTSGTLGITITATSGGIPYFSSTSAMGSSALMTANAFILGGGAGTTPYNTSSSMLWNDTKKSITQTAGTLAAGDAIYNILGTFATSGTSSAFGMFSNPTSAGSTGGAGQWGTGALLNAGYTGSGTTGGGFFESLAANTGTDLNLAGSGAGSADYGVYGFSTRSGSGAGVKVGVAGEAEGSTGVNVGVQGKAQSALAGTDIGVLGVAFRSTEATDFKSVGGMFVYGSTVVAGFNKNSAIVVDGGTTPGDYEIVATNGANPVFTLDVQGGITINIGGGTQTGQSGVKTVRAGGGASDCTLTFTSGILTATTC